MPYPEKCLRGIANRQFIIEESGTKYATTELFQFQNAHARQDGWIPESINWLDHMDVIQFTTNQIKDGEPQFPIGVAIIHRRELDRLKNLASIFNYEREPIAGNDFHGNILLHNRVGKIIRNMIRSALALSAEIQMNEIANQ